MKVRDVIKQCRKSSQVARFHCHITQYKVFTGFCIVGCLFSPDLAYSREVVAAVAFLVHFMVG